MGNLCAIFKLFDISHIVYMLIAIIISVALIVIFKKMDGNSRKYSSIVMVSLAGLFVIFEFVGRIMDGADIFENLPLNAFHVFVYVLIYIEVTKKTSWIKFGYFVIVPISFISLFVVPNYYCEYSSASLALISYFVINGILIGYSVLQLIWSDEYLSQKDILNVFLNFVMMVGIAHIVNVIWRFTTLGVHADYFGTMAEEYDVVIGWLSSLIKIPFVNVLPLLAVLIGLEYLLKLPFDVIRNKHDKKSQYEELVALGNMKAQMNRRMQGKSQVLIRSDIKASPSTPKRVTNTQRDGFVSVTKEVQVNKDDK